jgi:surface polysaccharide O-acyltransferase-like enzyme
MNRLQHFIKYGLFTIFWMLLIWFLSSQSSLDVGLTGFGEVFFKKLAHFFMYTILALLLSKLLIGYQDWSKQKANLAGLVCLVFLLGILYSVLDELHQSFVPNRTPSFFDVGIDTLGVFFGLVWGIRLATEKLRKSWWTLLTK